MFCRYCGFQNPDGAPFCGKCGKQLAAPQQQRFNVPQQMSQTYPPKKKKHTGCLIAGIIVGVIAVLFVALCVAVFVENKNEILSEATAVQTTEAETTKETTEKATEKETTTEQKEKSASLEKQFRQIGFTEKEAKDVANKFRKMGFTEISNIEPAVNGGSIDDLQAFRCKVFDYSTLQVNFTVENRTLCYVEFAGLPTTEYETYFNTFGKLKYKAVNGKTSVVMYDIWDEEGEIIPGAVGYKAVFDYKSEKISEYKG